MPGGLRPQHDSPERSSRAIHPLGMLALALAAGMSLKHVQWLGVKADGIWIWLIVAGAAGLLSFALCALGMRAAAARKWWRSPLLLQGLLACAMFAFGAAWLSITRDCVRPHDLSAMLGDDATLVRLRGVALGPPVLKSRVGGALAKFDYRPPSTYFPLNVTALISHDGSDQPACGQVLVRIDDTVSPFRSGDRVEVLGFLIRPAAPRNPGEFDYRQYARSLGQAGILTAGTRDVLMVTPHERSSIASMLLNLRDDLRRRAGAWLLSDLPPTATSRDTLLSSILLGERDEQIDGVNDAFQRVGLAHVLAISGFHLGVLAGFVLLLARLWGGDRRWHGIVVIGFVLLYLVMIEVRMPVLRAGVMTIAASAGLLTGRRLQVQGLLWLSAIALLLWRPDQLFNAGFQLTFGIVIAIVYFEPLLRRRLFRHTHHEAATTGMMLLHWLKSATSVSITSWLAALPIALYHFGFISPWGIALSIASIPLAAIILALGFLKMILSAVFPSAALLLGYPLSLITDVLLLLVQLFDAIPGSVIHVHNPSVIWALLAVLWGYWWMAGDRWLWRVLVRLRSALRGFAASHRGGTSDQPQLHPSHQTARTLSMLRRASTVGLLLWLIWPQSLSATLRIDMLAVGDGSCFVIRSDDSAVVFDAGSSTDLNIARRSLIPALRHLGIRSIDCIVISHTDADHYSAVIELALAFNVREALVTGDFLEAARTDPLGPVALVLERLNAQRVMVRRASTGMSRQFGSAHWNWLHPPPDKTYARDNDGSMVIQIEAGQRRVLLCGDIQQQAMLELLNGSVSASLRADVMELPHHGSFNDVAVSFINHVQPAIVMQSTGWSRWQRDRWAEYLQAAQRLVTARDGACWVEIASNGEIISGRFCEK